MLSRVSCMCLWRGAAESREHIRHIGATYPSPAVSDLPAADISFGVELTRGPRRDAIRDAVADGVRVSYLSCASSSGVL